MNELSGTIAQTALAPANATYASRQMMWGGQVSLPKRERFCTANATEIAAMAGQKILFSGRAPPLITVCWSDGLKKHNNGNTITANAHAKIGTIAQISSIGVENR